MSRRSLACAQRAMVLLALAVLGLLVFASPAYAYTYITVKWGALPAGYSAEEYPGESKDWPYSLTISRADTGDEYSASVGVVQTYSWPYQSLESWVAASDPVYQATTSTDALWHTEWRDHDYGTTEIGGKSAYYQTFLRLDSYGDESPYSGTKQMEYIVDLGDGGYLRIGYGVHCDTWGTGVEFSLDTLEALNAEVEAIYESMTFTFTSDAPATATSDSSTSGTMTSSPPPSNTPTNTGTSISGSSTGNKDEGSTPWKTAAGGAAALAAAVAAIIGAAAKTTGQDEKERDPNKPVGYILNVSSDSLRVTPDQSQPLTATVYQVMPDGRMENAAANIVLTPPAGVAVDAGSGASPLSALVWQTGAVPTGAQLLVDASAAGGSYQTAVAIEGRGEIKLNVVFEPADKRQVIVDGGDYATLVATVELPPGATADPNLNMALVRESIDFSSASEWLDFSQKVDWGEGKAVNVAASQPNVNHPETPPPSCVVQVKAEVGTTVLSENVSIAVVNPVIDAEPDMVELAAGSHATVEVRVWIDPPGGAQWEFETFWRDGSQPLALVDPPVPTGPGACTLTLTEDSAGKLDTTRPEDSATLRVVAKAPGCPDLERYIKVIVAQEGLFIESTGQDLEDGSFHIKADGKGEATEVYVRVYVSDGSGGKAAPDLALAQDVVFEIAGEEGTPGYAGLNVGEFKAVCAGTRQLNDPSAIFRLSLQKRLPTGGKVLPALVRASVPGRDETSFAKDVRVGLAGIDTRPYSADWQTELDNCKEVIFEYVPVEYIDRLLDLVNERSKTMGSEGLYVMRQQLWTFAHNQLVKQAHEHLDAAWWHQQIEDTLDWVSWCGDIAFGVASGSYVGTLGAIGLGLLKPVLVTFMEAYVQKESPWDVARAQLGVLVSTIESCATDPDLIAMKLTGEKKALAWAVFIGYYFFKEVASDRDHSVTKAMKNVGKQLRDEGLIIFLRRVAGVKPGVQPEAEPAKPGAPEAPAKPAGPNRPEVQLPKPPKSTEPAGRSAQTRARDLSDRIHEATRGGEVALGPELVSAIMRDPDAARELRRQDPGAYGRYADARGMLRDAHDIQLEQIIREREGPTALDVKVETVGSDRGIDRDHRVQVLRPSPYEGGDPIWVELPPAEWTADSHRIFAEQTGGPTGPDSPTVRDIQAEYALAHQQLGTNVDSRQACPDMSDISWEPDAQGNLVPTRHYDTKTGRALTNIERVEKGQTKLQSGEETGQEYQNKVSDSMDIYDGEAHPTLDALAQAQKAGDSLNGCRSGYVKQGLTPGALDPQVAHGMEIVEQGAKGNWTPEATDRALREQAHFERGLAEYMEAVGREFTSLDNVN